MTLSSLALALVVVLSVQLVAALVTLWCVRRAERAARNARTAAVEAQRSADRDLFRSRVHAKLHGEPEPGPGRPRRSRQRR